MLLRANASFHCACTSRLRVLSIIPLVLAGLFARMVWHRRKALSRSIAVVELSARIVLDHPALLLLCAAHLGVFLALTLPFLSIFARLFLVGHFSTGSGSSGLVWHVEQRASLLAWATLITWLWTWAVLRGVQRVTVAGVISHWYFHRQSSGSGASAERVADVEEGEDSLPGPTPGGWLPPHGDEADDAGPDATEVVRAAFARATGPALGTICLSALLLSLARAGALAAEGARRVTRSRLPTFLQPLTHLAALLAGTSAVLRGFSDYALVYVGISGENFWVSAKRAARLASRHGVKGVMEGAWPLLVSKPVKSPSPIITDALVFSSFLPPSFTGLIINLVLNLTALALAFLAGVAGFLFSAHQLHTPADAPLVGFLCAAVPYWTLRMCADVLSNA